MKIKVFTILALIGLLVTLMALDSYSMTYRAEVFMRNPASSEYEYDYAANAGIKTKIMKIDAGYERESGESYNKLLLKTAETKSSLAICDKLSFEWNYNEKSETNNQWIYKTFDSRTWDERYLKSRVSAQWIQWEDPMPMIGFEYGSENKIKKLTIQYDTFIIRNILRINYNVDIGVGNIIWEWKAYDYKQPDWRFGFVISNGKL